MYYYLKQHRKVFMSSVKEPKFFCDSLSSSDNEKPQFTKSREAYMCLFGGVKNEEIIGEASADYLYCQESAERIHNFNDQAKIIVLIRNPVQRAYSHYLLIQEGGREDKSFGEVIEEKNHYIKRGLYYSQIKRYLDVFGKNKVKVIKSEDFKEETEKVIIETLNFLGLEYEGDIETEKKYNKSGVVISETIKNVLEHENKIKKIVKKLVPEEIVSFVGQEVRRINKQSRKKPDMKNKLKRKLKSFYKKDVEKLEEMLREDLSKWK